MDESKKKNYNKPSIIAYGNVKNITKGFSVGSVDAPDGDGKP